MVSDGKFPCSCVLSCERKLLTSLQVTATGARGASTALVGSPQTLSDSILDYVDLGCELISIRGYDNYHDAVDYGRYILPRVREELEKREKGTSNPEAATATDGAVPAESG